MPRPLFFAIVFAILALVLIVLLLLPEDEREDDVLPTVEPGVEQQEEVPAIDPDQPSDEPQQTAITEDSERDGEQGDDIVETDDVTESAVKSEDPSVSDDTPEPKKVRPDTEDTTGETTSPETRDQEPLDEETSDEEAGKEEIPEKITTVTPADTSDDLPPLDDAMVDPSRIVLLPKADEVDQVTETEEETTALSERPVLTEPEVSETPVIRPKVVAEPEEDEAPAIRPKVVAEPEEDEAPVIRPKVVAEPEEDEAPAIRPKVVAEPEEDEAPAISPKVVAEPEEDEAPAIRPKVVAEPEEDEAPAISPKVVAEPEKDEAPVIRPKVVAEPEEDEAPAISPKVVAEPEEDEAPVIRPKVVAEPEEDEAPAIRPKVVAEPEEDEAPVIRPKVVAAPEKDEAPAIRPKVVAEPEEDEVPVIRPEVVAEPGESKGTESKIETVGLTEPETSKAPVSQPSVAVKPETEMRTETGAETAAAETEEESVTAATGPVDPEPGLVVAGLQKQDIDPVESAEQAGRKVAEGMPGADDGDADATGEVLSVESEGDPERSPTQQAADETGTTAAPTEDDGIQPVESAGLEEPSTGTEDESAESSPGTLVALAKVEEPKPAEEIEVEPLYGGPSFDIVRIEPDGSTVIAGQALPDSTVSVFLDGNELISETVPHPGSFVFFLDLPVQDGPMSLSLVEVTREGYRFTSEEVVLVVPSSPDQQPKVVIADDEGAKVVQDSGRTGSEGGPADEAERPSMAAIQPDDSGDADSDEVDKRTPEIVAEVTEEKVTSGPGTGGGGTGNAEVAADGSTLKIVRPDDSGDMGPDEVGEQHAGVVAESGKPTADQPGSAGTSTTDSIEVAVNTARDPIQPDGSDDSASVGVEEKDVELVAGGGR